VTLLEFDRTSQEALEVQQPEPKARDVQLAVKEPGDVVVECLDHKLCNFVKGKPWSLLISEMQLSIMLYIVALSGRCWLKTLVALISNPCLDIITMSPK
jgi:hypothetical protein